MSSTTLNDFISNVKKTGIARLTHFEVIISPPKKLTRNLDQKLLMLCDRVPLPGTTMATNEVQVYGESRSMPYQRMFDKISLSFYVDADMEIKRYFDAWMEIIINPKTHNHSYYKDYISTIEIIVHDLEHNDKYKVVLSECYPTAIGSISMDYSARDIMKLDVTMAYKYYRIHEYKSPDIDFSKPIDITDYRPASLLAGNAFTANTIDSVVTTRTAMQDPFGYGYSSLVSPGITTIVS